MYWGPAESKLSGSQRMTGRAEGEVAETGCFTLRYGSLLGYARVPIERILPL